LFHNVQRTTDGSRGRVAKLLFARNRLYGSCAVFSSFTSLCGAAFQD